MSEAATARFTLENRNGVGIDFVARGGTITSIRVPDHDGRVADVVPGFDTAEEYAGDTRYMGGLIGRFANRIANGRFSLDVVVNYPGRVRRRHRRSPNRGPEI